MISRTPEVEAEAAMMNRFAEFLFGPKPQPEVIDEKEAARRRLTAAQRVVQQHRVSESRGFIVPETDRERARDEARAAEVHAMSLGVEFATDRVTLDLVALRALVCDPRACIPRTSAIPIDRMVLRALLDEIDRANSETEGLIKALDGDCQEKSSRSLPAMTDPVRAGACLPSTAGRR